MNKLLVGFLVVLLLVPNVSAVLIGVNRVNVDFNNILRGGYAEQFVTVTSGSSNDVFVYYEARGEAADWIRFEPEDVPVAVNEDNNGRIKIIVEPPADARVDEYDATVLISTGPLGAIQGNVGANVEVAFEVKVNIQVTDTQVLTCSSGGMQLLDTEIGRDVPFIVSVTNNGNVRIDPDFTIEVYDQFQDNLISVLEYSLDDEILPTTTRRIETELSNSLEEGQYWAYITTPLCSASRQLVTFSILERGGISDVGELIRIENDAWATTSELIPFNVYFRNRGDRVLSAQFKGVVTKDGRIMEVVNSELRDVAPGEVSVFEIFYGAPEFGQYKIKGRVHYNNKITFEKGSVVNVNDEVQSFIPKNDSFLSIALTIVVIIIGVLAFLIIRKKKKFRY